jgi:hypothetical protein
MVQLVSLLEGLVTSSNTCQCVISASINITLSKECHISITWILCGHLNVQVCMHTCTQTHIALNSKMKKIMNCINEKKRLIEKLLINKNGRSKLNVVCAKT